MGRIVCGSDYHSEHLDPPLRGQTEWFKGGWTVRPLWSQIVTIGNVCGANRCSVGWCGSECQCLNWVLPDHQGTVFVDGGLFL
jgi:hypothetical protein